MKKPVKLILTFMVLLLVATSCNDKKENKHFLTDKTYRKQVHEQFLKRKKAAANREKELFSILSDKNISLEQKEALEFLYAYMPLPDLADYDGTFFLNQVNAAFHAREYFPWGKSIPEEIFRHFVLVYRINNEYLDTARMVFLEELKERVKGLSMAEAALEVNHWCHEKVTYRATDGRTSAPLALVKTSWGRCGEESTFTATALRAIGIPTRQCYTPRWAHSNSNHAWVEVWIDGKWHYLGACEPEPELDVAWFTAPAKRAMMVHTNVFGLYTGPEEKNVETPLYSIINLLPNYASTRNVKVKVVDEQGNPVEKAIVKYKVYNYAELFPISTSVTDAKGMASVVSGKGDLMVWVKKDDVYGYKKSTPNDDMVTITLSNTAGAVYEESFTMTAPAEQAIKELSPEQIAANDVRLAHEDSIRNAYMSTFANQAYAYDIASMAKLDATEVWKYLEMAQGNWKEVSAFMQSEKDNPWLFPFLATLLEKDLRDTPAAYLKDHLKTRESLNTPANLPEEIIIPYILSPRIALELITPWRSFFQQKEIAEEIAGATPSAEAVIEYVKKNILINEKENYYSCPITPRGVYELRIADSRSRNIFFVAVCRSLNLPARIETATGKPQYYQDGQWIDALLSDTVVATENAKQKGSLTLHSDPANTIKPDYSMHYTLAFFKEGDFQTLNYRNDPRTNQFPYTLELDEGYYRLLIGSRANDGSVAVRTEYFNLRADEPLTKTITMPETAGKLFVRGSVDMNSIVTPDNGSKKILTDIANGKGLMLCFIDPGKEPSKHILQDFPAQKQALEEWGGGILLLTPDDKVSAAFDPTAFKSLPQQTVWGTDVDRALLNTVANELQITFQDNFPLTVYLSTNGGILYSFVGYRLGISEEVIKTIRMEKESLK